MPITYDTAAAADEGRQGLSRRYRDYNDGELEGFSQVVRAQEGGNGRWGRGPRPGHLARVASAAELVTDMLNARAPSWALKEAIRPTHMATAQALESNYPGLFRLEEAYGVSDFPNLLGDVLDRMLLSRFREYPQGWRRYIDVSRPLTDFRTVKRIKLEGAEGQYSQFDDMEGIQYARNLAETPYTYSPDLYALGVKLSFQSIMDDDLDAFDSIPDRLGRGGRRTIAKFMTDLLFDSNGPDATFFSSGNGNLLTGNPVLDVAAIGTAMETLLGFTDADSEPILVEGVVLVYPPGLHVTVQNLLNQLTVDVTDEGGTSTKTVRVNNWIVRDLEAVLDPYIPIVATTNGDTSWILAKRPNSGAPMAEVGFLRGFEEPQLFRKAGNTARVGGGVDQTLGDFESMSQHYKGVLGLGGTLMEPKSAVASDGSGS